MHDLPPQTQRHQGGQEGDARQDLRCSSRGFLVCLRPCPPLSRYPASRNWRSRSSETRVPRPPPTSTFSPLAAA
eukprot:9499606-Pyramimonas_sp.AAC.1